MRSFALAVVLGCVALWASAADELLQRAKALLDGNDAKAAYALLAPLQPERAGDPEYDYLLGVCALELGRNTEAVFALERVLAVQPNNAPARAQIARAYFNLKETDAAKREFETVKGQGVPVEVSTTIDRYLAAIDRIADAERFSARFYLEFTAGYDSNVNAATSIAEVAIPLFNNAIFRLAPSSVETGDAFVSGAGGVAIRNPLSETLALIGGLSAYKRFNFNESTFDTGYLDGYLGLTRKRSRSTWTLVAQANSFFLNDPLYDLEYRNAFGGTLQWTHDLNARNQVTAYLQYAALTYPEQEPRDADRYIAGVGYAHAFRGGDPTVYAGVYGGIEKERDEAFDYLGYRPLGLRLGGQKSLSDRIYLFATAAAEWRDYRGSDPFFAVEREDEQYSASLGVHYLLPNAWRMSPQVTWLQNSSNIALNEWERWQAFVSLRRDW